ncbi:MAG: hypothetical protein ACQESF_04940 [Nanobdellota archaeon]
MTYQDDLLDDNFGAEYDSPKINGKRVFEYIPSKYVLKLNKRLFSEDDLTDILKSSEYISKGTRRIDVPIPFQGSKRVEPVQKIEYMPDGFDLLTRIHNLYGYCRRYFS